LSKPVHWIRKVREKPPSVPVYAVPEGEKIRAMVESISVASIGF
jgi:hypothetical protein